MDPRRCLLVRVVFTVLAAAMNVTLLSVVSAEDAPPALVETEIKLLAELPEKGALLSFVVSADGQRVLCSY